MNILSGVKRCIDCRYCADRYCQTYRMTIVGDEKHPRCSGVPKSDLPDFEYIPDPGAASSFITYKEPENVLVQDLSGQQEEKSPKKGQRRKGA